MSAEMPSSVPSAASAGGAASGGSGSSDSTPFRYTSKLAEELELKWQSWWDSHQTFKVPGPGQAGFDAARPKFYCLDMFPYPSGAGLHVGHPEGYTATDIICRYKRSKGFNVLHPMGWDAFGLPAEQYAIATGVHPSITTKKAIENFRRQLGRFGFCYDWSRQVGTIDPEYYKWTQWIFLKVYGSWFDPQLNKAQPIEQLVQKLSRGEIAAQVNPAADEVASIEPAPASWQACTSKQQRQIIDSYRLAYVGETTVNWCPKLGTVLANDEVIDGKSERGGYPVLRKPMKQWMIRITAYADRLLAGLDTVAWPESTKTMQREWIGRSEGAEIEFGIGDQSSQEAAQGRGASLRVFTTRPDTLFGATYMVVAPEHPLVEQVLSGSVPQARQTMQAVASYVAAARNRSDVERMESKEKTGVDLGIDAINPATGKPIPIWVADYVLMGYGTGAIMAVPAHDERDYEFAKAFKLPIIEVVQPPATIKLKAGECFAGDGIAINSSGPWFSIDGQPTQSAKQAVIAWLESSNLGTRKVNHKLRDWTFSRQRYWGEPFPIVFDANGDHHAVAEDKLPVILPELTDYAPQESQDPQPLLAKAGDWVNVSPQQVGLPAHLGKLTRETNTMPGSAGSSWYFLRYCDPANNTALASRESLQYWTNVDLYMGGSEHTVGHLLYSRMWNQILHDLGHVTTAEPFQRLVHQGMITSFAYERADKTLVPTDQVTEVADGEYIETATGGKLKQIVAKMSKSLKNVVNPDDIIADFGADTFRLYEMYMGPLEASKPWNTKDIIGPHRFLQRLWRSIVDEQTGATRISDEAPTPELEKLLHRTIAGVTTDIDNISLHTAIAKLIELNNEFTRITASAPLPRRAGLVMCQLLAPFCPHIAEELWQRLGGGVNQKLSIVDAPWPTFDPALLIDSEVEMPVQVLGKVRGKIMVPRDADAKSIEALALQDPNVQKYLEGKTPKKVIVVPGRMINFVI
jgi:leucyl-tRNA synthetase